MVIGIEVQLVGLNLIKMPIVVTGRGYVSSR